jgi:hypothetical protein
MLPPLVMAILACSRRTWPGNDFSFLLADIRCNFLLETILQRKSGRNWKKRFYSSFVTQRFCNGTEMVHLQRNAFGTVQKLPSWNERIVCNGFKCFGRNALKTCFCNGIFSWKLYIRFGESFEGKRLCNDNFCFTEKQIPFCQETIIVSIRLQRFNLEKLLRSEVILLGVKFTVAILSIHN